MHKIKKTSVTRIVTGRIFSILPAVALQFIIIFAIMKWLAPFATLFYGVCFVRGRVQDAMASCHVCGTAARRTDVSALRK